MSERQGQNWDEGDTARRIDRYWLESEAEWRQMLGENIRAEFGEAEPMLDVGCGSGLIYGQMRREGVVTSDSYVGGDTSEKMLAIARERFPDAYFAPLDIFDMPYADRSQENVICIQVLQHLPHYREALGELLRITRRKLYISSWFGPEDRINFGDSPFGGPFFENRYSLAKFLSYLTAERMGIQDLRVHHLQGVNYSVSMSF